MYKQKPPAPPFRLEWDAITDPCLAEYTVLSADDPARKASFVEEAVVPVAASPSLETGALLRHFYLVAGKGTDGLPGPTGHCEETASCP